MSTSGITIEEMSESITGFDELAIEKHMGLDLYQDGARKPVGLVRSLVFVHQRRAGLSDADAKKHVLNMTVKQVNGYFEQSNDIDPQGDADSDSGKDASPVESTPLTSPPSAS